KANFGVNRKRLEMLALLLRAAEELADLGHDARGQGNHVTCRESIGGSGRIVRRVAKCGRRDDVGGGGGDHASLDDSPPPAVLDRAYEPVRLERPEVVI